MEKDYSIIGSIMARHPEITQEEQEILNEWLNQDDNRTIFETAIAEGNKQQVLSRLYELREENENCFTQFNTLIERPPVEKKLVRMRQVWKGFGIAASVLLVLCAAYLLVVNRSNRSNDLTKIPDQSAPLPNDANPGSFKAKLTLADGSTVVLDSAATGQLAEQGNVTVLNKEGKLVYEQKGKHSEVLYNTLTTAKGETYGMMLSDGSKVWLNSQSSIRYPVVFNQDVRKVEITGEVYFEVAALSAEGQQKVPFIVSVNDMEVEVLGTHFNINSYADEPSIKTTLLEGKVRVRSQAMGSQIILAPGEQAVLQHAQGGKMILSKTKDLDVEAEVAWRFGYFQFVNADLKTVMHQLERWYDMEVVYQDNVSNDLELIGKIPRSMNLSKVLDVLQTQQVHFKIEGHKIIVLP